jgi:hypothetical protein
MVHGHRWKKSYRYDLISPPVFSRDGKHVAYMAELDCNRFIVLDGKEGKPYDAIDITDAKEAIKNRHLRFQSPVFSPDSQRVAFWAKHGNTWRVVINGYEGKEEFANPTKGAAIMFDSNNSLHYLADKLGSVYFVKEILTEEKDPH